MFKITSKKVKGSALPSITTEFSIKVNTVNMNLKSTIYDNKMGVSEET